MRRDAKVFKYLKESKDWSTVSQLSFRLGVSTDQVRKSLRFLVQHGLMEEQRETGLYRAKADDTKSELEGGAA